MVSARRCFSTGHVLLLWMLTGVLGECQDNTCPEVSLGEPLVGSSLLQAHHARSVQHGEDGAAEKKPADGSGVTSVPLQSMARGQSASLLEADAAHLKKGNAAGAAAGAIAMTAGATAPLSEAGYQAVAALRSPKEMEVYVRRVIDDLGFKVADDKGLTPLLPRYDGDESTQSLGELTTELAFTEGRGQGRAKGAWLQLADTRHESSVKRATSAATSGAGAAAQLDQTGYAAVAATKSQDEMKTFTRRLLSTMKLRVADDSDAKLSGLVQWYSGEKDVQDFARLEAELKRIAQQQNGWIVADPAASQGPPLAAANKN